jgi:hypothetical protein
VVGEWMAPTFLQNNAGAFTKVNNTEDNLNGLWQTIAPFDIDDDGDTDYIIGNWGKNSKFKASKEFPMLMYYGDFDANGSPETITSIEKNGKYYTTAGLNELKSQLEFIKKDFTSYAEFSGKTFDEIFSKEILNKAERIFKIQELASGYLENNQGQFVFKAFDQKLQIAPITCTLVYDFDNNGKDEILLAGNLLNTSPYHGRLDGFSGALLSKENTIYAQELGLNLANKQIKAMNIIQLNAKNYVLVTINNEKAELYEIQTLAN